MARHYLVESDFFNQRSTRKVLNLQQLSTKEYLNPNETYSPVQKNRRSIV